MTARGRYTSFPDDGPTEHGSTRHSSGGTGPDLPAAALDVVRDGTVYSSSSARRGKPSEESVRVRREHPAEHFAEPHARRLVDRLIQRRDGQRLPQQLDETRRLAVPFEPLANGRARIGITPASMPQCAQRQAIAPVDARSIGTHRRADCSGGGSGGQARRDARPALIDDVDGKSGLQVDVASVPMRRRNRNVS